MDVRKRLAISRGPGVETINSIGTGSDIQEQRSFDKSSGQGKDRKGQELRCVWFKFWFLASRCILQVWSIFHRDYIFPSNIYLSLILIIYSESFMTRFVVRLYNSIQSIIMLVIAVFLCISRG